MAVDHLYTIPDMIVRDPETCGGKPILSGTRTGVHDVVGYVELYGGDMERVREEALPHLSMEQIHSAIRWYGDHREEIDEILRKRRERYRRGLAEANPARKQRWEQSSNRDFSGSGSERKQGN
jgi:uncharacterized protein (DUF433 family)